MAKAAEDRRNASFGMRMFVLLSVDFPGPFLSTGLIEQLLRRTAFELPQRPITSRN